MPLTAEQYEALVRKSLAIGVNVRWCICFDPENCDQRELDRQVTRCCRAHALKLKPARIARPPSED